METENGNGWAVGTIDGLGAGLGFRKIRGPLGVTAFGVGPGGLARVDPGTVRDLRNRSSEREATYLCVGGDGGYVGRDGVSDAGR